MDGGLPFLAGSCYIQAMKKFLALAMLLMVFATPAFAAKHHHHRHHARQSAHHKVVHHS
jgi:hypothetical protein